MNINNRHDLINALYRHVWGYLLTAEREVFYGNGYSSFLNRKGSLDMEGFGAWVSSAISHVEAAVIEGRTVYGAYPDTFIGLDEECKALFGPHFEALRQQEDDGQEAREQAALEEVKREVAEGKHRSTLGLDPDEVYNLGGTIYVHYPRDQDGRWDSWDMPVRVV